MNLFNVHMASNLIKFLDLSVVSPNEKRDLHSVLDSHLNTGKFILSDEGEDFEFEFSKFHNRLFGVGTNSGTDALVLAIRLLDLPASSEIATSVFSWLASGSAILLAGHRPVFIDVFDNLQVNLDLLEETVKLSNGSIKACLIPHLHGNVSSLSRLKKIREDYSVHIIEDCAQAFRSRDESDLLAGTCGDFSAFSFNPMKTLGGFGDGGILLFDNESVLEKARRLRHSGVIRSEGLATEQAYNCRLDALHASFLRVRMMYVQEKLAIRRGVAAMYMKYLPPHVKSVTDDNLRSNHYVYQVVCECRDELMSYLAKVGIETRIRHNFLITDHPVFNHHSQEFPSARKLLPKILCLPIHDKLAQEDVVYVCEHINNFYSRIY